MTSYSDYLNKIFPGLKVQKISLNTGFSCPNRDGTIGMGGCIYCRNDAFTPAYCFNISDIREQIKKGKNFFSRKYLNMKFLAYFQSFTSTYSNNPELLQKIYSQPFEDEDIVGIVVSSRPDTLKPEILDVLEQAAGEKPVFIEIGAESSSNKTLQLINRGHTWQDVEKAVRLVAERNFHCGLHLIAGLPDEDNNQIIENVEKACKLPIETIKLHQLQILYGTPLHEKWMKGEINVQPLELDDYLSLCKEILKIIPDTIIIERFLSQSPPELVVAPKWGLKNYEFVNLLRNL